jgi:hypothetical protein
MGWNSWDCYAANVTEEQLLAHAEYMAKNLKQYGWEYIVCDIQWACERKEDSDEVYIPFADLCMDEYSRLIPAPNRFPSSINGKGFAPIAEKVHALGLKFGIHIMRGIPRQAVHQYGKIKSVKEKGQARLAREVANPFSVSRWQPDMYGVDRTKAGAQDYYDSLFEIYASWGVDYVKVDDICNTNMWPHKPYSGKDEIEMIRLAIDKCGRPMVLSLSPGPAIITEAWHLGEYANMWRITDDFWDSWPLLLDMFTRCEIWQDHVKPGNWPDCDMLPLGQIGVGFIESGKSAARNTKFTKDEQITLMTLWSIFRAPLMLGAVLSEPKLGFEIDDWTLSLITNPEVLAVGQLGKEPHQIRRSAFDAVWVNKACDEAGNETGETNLALFNLSDEAREVPLDMPVSKMRDLWEQKDITTKPSFHIPAHGSVLLRIK